jgi:hypothetical protein
MKVGQTNLQNLTKVHVFMKFRLVSSHKWMKSFASHQYHRYLVGDEELEKKFSKIFHQVGFEQTRAGGGGQEPRGFQIFNAQSESGLRQRFRRSRPGPAEAGRFPAEEEELERKC